MKRANLEVRKNFFSIRAAKQWDELPEEVKRQKTLNAFKGAYDVWKRGSAVKQTIHNDSTTRGEDTSGGGNANEMNT